MADIENSDQDYGSADARPWNVLSPGNTGPLPEEEYDRLRRIAPEGVRALEQINAADKAKAVPYLKIWQIDRDSNKPIGEELSLQFWKPPVFGSSLGERYGERPPVSLVSVHVKHVNPGGYILFREVDVKLKVHRPDAIFNSLNDTSNVIGSLLTPGRVHILKYGWQGAKNPMLSTGVWDIEKYPEMNSEEQSQVDYAKKNDLPEPKFYKNIVAAKAVVRFSVTNYTFSISADNQIDISVHGIEDGELNTRYTNLLDCRGIREAPALKKVDDKDKPKIQKQYMDGVIQDLMDKIVRQLNDPVEVTLEDGKKTKERYIEFADLLRVLFSDPFSKTFTQLGYNHIHFWTGVFNSNAPDAAAIYGGQKLGASSIGKLLIRYKDVSEILNGLVSTNGKITVYNVLGQFFGLINSSKFYVNRGYDAPPASMPELIVVPQYNPDGNAIDLWIIDRKRYLTTLGSLGFTEFNLSAKRLELQKDMVKLEQTIRGLAVPYISMYQSESYVQSSKFDVVADELMKSIFIKKAIVLDRHEITQNDQAALQINRDQVESSLLYRSAIKGQITMIGNFIFNIMGIMWLNFGVKAWDGFFYVLTKEDKIDSTGFTTSITVQAEGSNPLGAKPQSQQDFKGVIADRMNKVADPGAQGLSSQNNTGPNAQAPSTETPTGPGK